MQSPPENRDLTIAVCRRLGIWPLTERCSSKPSCCCPRCFEPETADQPLTSDELAELRRRRSSVKKFPWERAA